MAAVAICSCRQSGGNGPSAQSQESQHSDTSQPAPFPTDSVRQSVSSTAGSVEVYIDYPTGADAAARTARSFIHSQLFGSKPYRAEGHPDSIARQYCELTLARFAQSLQQLHIGEVSREEAPEEGTEIRLVYESPRYITYESWHYSYFTGGGHGTYRTQGLTIRRRDGKRMTHLVEDHAQLRRQMVYGLMEYFGVGDTITLSRYLTVPLRLLPLPSHPPYLTADGLRVQYDLYDICPMDDGAPAFTIPLDSIVLTE